MTTQALQSHKICNSDFFAKIVFGFACITLYIFQITLFEKYYSQKWSATEHFFSLIYLDILLLIFFTIKTFLQVAKHEESALIPEEKIPHGHIIEIF